MITELSELVDRLNNPLFSRTSVMSWGCPIPSFGNLLTSRVATLGLNPSNREFMDSNGKELNGSERRFHSLSSLKIKSWEDVTTKQLKLMLELSNNYFIRNPYDMWFKKLDYVISGTNASYYFPTLGACHLDLIPYATLNKWADLPASEKNLLLELSNDTLGLLLRNSPINLLVLNGQTVVESFEKICSVKLERRKMPSWELPRRSLGVAGYSYYGEMNKIEGYKLKKAVLILGYNHNLQSSFGVTTKVLTSVRNWITSMYNQRFI
jgi:hypothetical protein